MRLLRLRLAMAGAAIAGPVFLCPLAVQAASSLYVGAGLVANGGARGCSTQFSTVYGNESYCPNVPGYSGLLSVSSAIAAQESYDAGEAEASATADPDGMLRVSLHGGPGDNGTGLAIINDVLHVAIAGAGAQTVTQLMFDFGVQISLPNMSNNTDTAAYSFSVEGNYLMSDFSYEVGTVGGVTSPYYVTSSVGNSVQYGVSGAGGSIATYVIGPSADVTVHILLECGNSDSVTKGSNCSASAGQVGGYRFGLVAQPGVTFTADSLKFPYAPSAAPEPATWAMMLCGLGLVGGAVRHRSRRAARLV